MNLSLTPQEQYVNYYHGLFPSNSSYNIAYLAKFNGDLDLAAFNAAVQTCHQANGNLRAVFMGDNKTITDSIFTPIELEHIDDLTLKRAQAILVTEKSFHFSLDKFPLYRVRLISDGQKTYVTVVFSHAINDGYGLKLYLTKLQRALAGKAVNDDTKSLVELSQARQGRYKIAPTVDDSNCLFPQLTPLVVGFKAMTHNLTIQLHHYPNLSNAIADNKLSFNLLSLTVLQLALLHYGNHQTIAIKHLLLGRYNRQQQMLLGFLADATVQSVEKQESLSQLLAINQHYLEHLNTELTSSYFCYPPDVISPEVCYCNFGSLFNANQNLLITPCPQPENDEMWNDEVKLKVNVHRTEQQTVFVLRGLQRYFNHQRLRHLETLLIEALTTCDTFFG